MHPVKIKGETASFAKPPDWDESRDGPCGNLSVRVVREGIYNCHYSNWRPTQGELEQLKAGGVVELECVGVQPPVAVRVVPQYIKGGL